MVSSRVSRWQRSWSNIFVLLCAMALFVGPGSGWSGPRDGGRRGLPDVEEQVEEELRPHEWSDDDLIDLLGEGGFFFRAQDSGDWLLAFLEVRTRSKEEARELGEAVNSAVEMDQGAAIFASQCRTVIHEGGEDARWSRAG